MVFGSDAGAAVAHRDHHPIALAERPQGDLVRFHRAFGNCLRRVHEQVQHHLAEAPLVADDARHIRAVLAHQPCAVADLVSGHAHRRFQNVMHVHGAVPPLVGAGKSLQVAHDEADPLRAFLRSLDQFRDRLAHLRPLVGDHLEIRDHIGERIVDFVRHACSERSHRDHAVRG